MSVPISSACSRKYTAAHDSGTRPASAIKWIVLHSTEGPTAEGAASWFANPASEGSAHLVVDDDACFRTLANDAIPWAAPGADTNGFHIEQAGFAAWTRSEWRIHDTTLRRAAFKAALHAKLFDIPLRWVGPVGLRLGRKGVTTHRDISYAWPIQARVAGFHTDPGANYPKDVFMGYAQTYLAGMEGKQV